LAAMSSKEVEAVRLENQRLKYKLLAARNKYVKAQRMVRGLVKTLNELSPDLEQAAEQVDVLQSWGQDLTAEGLAELLCKAWHYQRSGKALSSQDVHVIDLHVYKYVAFKGAASGKAAKR